MMRAKAETASSGRRKRLLLKSLGILLLLGVLCFLLLSAIIAWGNRDRINGQPCIMIILGCKVQPWGEPSVLLKDRLDKALDYLKIHPDMLVVVSGGQGSDEPMDEASVMAEYLIKSGVPSTNILKENGSFSTWENLEKSLALLQENGLDVTSDILVVSNGFHLARVHMLWDRLTGTRDNLSTLAAPSSHKLSRWKMFFREPAGLVKSFIFDR